MGLQEEMRKLKSNDVLTFVFEKSKMVNTKKIHGENEDETNYKESSFLFASFPVVNRYGF